MPCPDLITLLDFGPKTPRAHPSPVHLDHSLLLSIPEVRRLPKSQGPRRPPKKLPPLRRPGHSVLADESLQREYKALLQLFPRKLLVKDKLSRLE